ncbi:MAG: M28 family peptidase [Xanthomonadales bacterium]|nr:M28 family peptidase [Xanthomonadales bacterium]
MSSIESSSDARWLELGDELLLCTDSSRPVARATELPVLRERSVPIDDLLLIQGFQRASSPFAEVLASGGRFAVVTAASMQASLDEHDVEAHAHAHSLSQEVPWNSVVVRRATNRPAPAKRSAAAMPRTDQLVAAIDGARWLADVGTLAGWDRHSLRSGIVNARDWIQGQFAGMSGMSVALDPFVLSGTTIHNVIATLPGTTRPDEIYVVGGHYDAIGGSFSPGGEDNASGCAGVLEIARVFAAQPPPSTMRFVCYSGEEQGLRGSQHQVGDLIASGEDDRVVHMLNMDMIGYTGDAELDCLLETEDEFAYLLDAYADAAARYTTLSIATSLFAFGSDHVPFIDAGMPALLTIENDWDSYPHYHRSTDVAANVSLDMGYQTLRMNVATLADLMGVDSARLFASGFED